MGESIVSIVAACSDRFRQRGSVTRYGYEYKGSGAAMIEESKHRHALANNLGRYEQVARDAVDNMCRRRERIRWHNRGSHNRRQRIEKRIERATRSSHELWRWPERR